MRNRLGWAIPWVAQFCFFSHGETLINFGNRLQPGRSLMSSRPFPGARRAPSHQ